jgi:hypothetical protein
MKLCTFVIAGEDGFETRDLTYARRLLEELE